MGGPLYESSAVCQEVETKAGEETKNEYIHTYIFLKEGRQAGVYVILDSNDGLENIVRLFSKCINSTLDNTQRMLQKQTFTS